MTALRQLWTRHLWSHYVAHAEYMRHIPKAVGVVGAIAFPLFFLLHELRSTKGYDSAWLRGTAAVLCLGLALRDHWPERFKSWYVPWSYVTYLFCLPFLMVFLALKNGGGSVSVANTFMGVFFLVLLTDWRNTVVMMVAGAGAAALLYIATTPQAAMPVDYLGRLPTLILVIIGGNAFKLSEKQIQAERLDAATALAGTIAHEMRNPLGQLRHSLSGIQQSLSGPGVQDQLTAVAHHELDNLHGQLAKGERAIERGLQVITMTLDALSAKPLDPGKFDVLSAAEVVRKAVDEYGYDGDAARESVSVDVREDFQFRGDETAYLYVLFNLIKNALYYLGPYPGTRVTITVGGHQIAVRDTGPGIPPEVLPTLFEPFHSFGKSGGTGLGLAYCQRVMKAFGGEIRCRSVAGSYTEFTMQFPPVGEEARQAHHEKVLQAARAVLAQKRLLLVEDDAAQRMTARHKLRPLGMVIDDAADGNRAMELLARHAYDLVLLDLNMPGPDGYHVAQKVRQGQVPANRYVRIVAHTSEPAHLARAKTQRAGMDGFVSKPSAQLPLVQALQKAMERRSSASPAGSRPLEQRRVLLADDSAYNRRAVAAYLREAGAVVVEADHGEAVLQALRRGPAFDAVLMDLNMPGMGGLDTSRAIRASKETWSAIPIIALTAHSDSAAVEGAREAGMNGFLVKPVEAGQLCEVVAELTAGRDTPAPRLDQPTVAAAPQREEGPLLNVTRLESYQRLGLLEELLADYLPEIARLVGVLEQAMAEQDLKRAQEAMHSLLGMSGEAGALALYQWVRGVYVPVLEQGRWPAPEEWLPKVQELAAATEKALRDYGASHSGAAATEG
ncbi:response regulator [Ramlibacter henchirensis]|uniref:histidine kinase n=1 Tax=Ramlibacter henchirensis TaxID=204072 RepID=A0A4Z0BRP8_9BURK|nr:hybrid sensor histidine kinase/response regulator [Ramlibacter henchirensis]TFZ00928.1 response regulator [Ramlibacter henchirensis]